MQSTTMKNVGFLSLISGATNVLTTAGDKTGPVWFFNQRGYSFFDIPRKLKVEFLLLAEMTLLGPSSAMRSNSTSQCDKYW